MNTILTKNTTKTEKVYESTRPSAEYLRVTRTTDEFGLDISIYDYDNRKLIMSFDGEDAEIRVAALIDLLSCALGNKEDLPNE